MKMLNLVPSEMVQEDPKQLIYHKKDEIMQNPVAFYNVLRRLKKHYHYKNVREFERYANANGKILVPANIFNWRSRTKIGLQQNDRVRIGRNHYYLVDQNKLSNNQIEQLQEQIEQIREELGLCDYS